MGYMLVDRVRNNNMWTKLPVHPIVSQFLQYNKNKEKEHVLRLMRSFLDKHQKGEKCRMIKDEVSKSQHTVEIDEEVIINMSRMYSPPTDSHLREKE